MKRRTFEEMISYFNQTVSDMDIARKYKMTLLGIVTALLQKHDEDVAQIVRCKDCKYSDTDNTLGVMFCWRISYHEANEDGFCSWAERRTDEADYRKE